MLSSSSCCHVESRLLPWRLQLELTPCSQLRSLSLANVRIMADATYSRWVPSLASHFEGMQTDGSNKRKAPAKP
jgi:hypothetical protein